MDIPVRDEKGRPVGEDKEEKRKQEALVRKKVEYLRAKIKGKEVSEADGQPDAEPPRAKARGRRRRTSGPERKVHITAEELKEGDLVVAYLHDKKSTYLTEVMEVTPMQGDSPWIKLHLFGRTAPGSEQFKKYWLDGRRRWHFKEAGTPFWQQIYSHDVLYKLQAPLQNGRLSQKDKAEMARLWPEEPQILTTMPSRGITRRPECPPSAPACQ